MKLSPVPLADLKEVCVDMQDMEKRTQLVVGIAFACALEGREKPGEKVINSYALVLPILSNTIDRVQYILDLDWSKTKAPIHHILADMRRQCARLEWKEGIILSWFDDNDDNDDGPFQASDPMKPSGITKRQRVAAV